MAGEVRSFANMRILMDQITGGTIKTSALQDLFETLADLIEDITADAGELNILDGATLDVGELNILDGVTATSDELNYLDITTLGAGAASKAVVLDSNGVYTGPTGSTSKFTWNVTSTSTSPSVNVEPFTHFTTMNGIGGVGGRALFKMTTEVALGGWANALKGFTDWGSAGRVTGLGSAVLAEMTMGAGTTQGTYAPVEVELNIPSGASLGTNTSLSYLSVNGDDSTIFDTGGYIMNVAGLIEGDTKCFNAHTLGNINEITHGLKILIGGTVYYLLLATLTNMSD